MLCGGVPRCSDFLEWCFGVEDVLRMVWFAYNAYLSALYSRSVSVASSLLSSAADSIAGERDVSCRLIVHGPLALAMSALRLLGVERLGKSVKHVGNAAQGVLRFEYSGGRVTCSVELFADSVVVDTGGTNLDIDGYVRMLLYAGDCGEPAEFLGRLERVLPGRVLDELSVKLECRRWCPAVLCAPLVSATIYMREPYLELWVESSDESESRGCKASVSEVKGAYVAVSVSTTPWPGSRSATLYLLGPGVASVKTEGGGKGVATRLCTLLPV